MVTIFVISHKEIISDKEIISYEMWTWIVAIPMFFILANMIYWLICHNTGTPTDPRANVVNYWRWHR